MTTFKKGDKVVCVDAENSSLLLKNGNVYTVKAFVSKEISVSGDDEVILEEFDNIVSGGGFFTTRFKLAEEQPSNNFKITVEKAGDVVRIEVEGKVTKEQMSHVLSLVEVLG